MVTDRSGSAWPRPGPLDAAQFSAWVARCGQRLGARASDTTPPQECLDDPHAVEALPFELELRVATRHLAVAEPQLAHEALTDEDRAARLAVPEGDRRTCAEAIAESCLGRRCRTGDRRSGALSRGRAPRR